MSEYEVIARKYRPKSFKEVVGQEAIVTTLINAIKHDRLAHAYLFAGPRGTGKTTLARAFAKALNCLNPGEGHEPCNKCSFCKEIAAGHSLDVLEIDGASHRGIDDVRQINDTVAYSASGGKYKIYIIDEVHMLTKEAFNALLKTLEEPPPKVKFFFATTEPHKVLPTIISRCQRFNLSRIPTEKIIEKLTRICQDMGVVIESEALLLLARRAEGGLRDAESLLDQILSFHEEGTVTASEVANILGVVELDVYFELDQAGKDGDLGKAFFVAERVFAEGKDLFHFAEGLTEHFRNILRVKLCGGEGPQKYVETAKLYRQDQCLDLLDFLVEAQSNLRSSLSPRVTLEAALLHILRSHQRLPIEFLVKRLTELEEGLETPQSPKLEQTPEAEPRKPATPAPAPKPKPKPRALPESKPKPELKPEPELKPAAPVSKEKKSQYDTLMHFAAVELDGQLKKKV